MGYNIIPMGYQVGPAEYEIKKRPRYVFASVSEIENGLKSPDCLVNLQAARACENNAAVSLDMIDRWMGCEKWSFHFAAMHAAIGRPEVSYQVIEQGLNDADAEVRTAALRACVCRTDVPVAHFDEALDDHAPNVAAAAARSIDGKPVPADIRTTWSKSKSAYRRLAAQLSVDEPEAPAVVFD